jgi:hypothetical protein
MQAESFLVCGLEDSYRQGPPGSIDAQLLLTPIVNVHADG